MLWLRFRPTTSRLARALGRSGLVVPCCVLLGCAIFPDHAVLPQSASGAGGTSSGGSAASADLGGMAGEPTALQPLGGSSGAASVVPEGGAPQGGSSGQGGRDGDAGDGDAGDGGEGGAAGAPSCAAPSQRSATFAEDTWIDSAQPGAEHASDAGLYVVGGNEPRRAIIAMTLPAAPVGASLLSGVVTLHLVGNADASLAARQLQLHILTQQPNVARTTWNNWSNGAQRRWTTPGGDFGPAVAEAILPATTQTGSLTFDVTQALAELFSSSGVPLALIVVEAAPAPAAPSALAFGSAEGDASTAPSLAVEYCPP